MLYMCSRIYVRRASNFPQNVEVKIIILGIHSMHVVGEDKNMRIASIYPSYRFFFG